MLAVVLQLGCASTVHRTLKKPEEARTLDRKSKFLKVHMRDGGLYVLGDWQVDESKGQLVGSGAFYNANRKQVSSGNQVIALAEVALLETNVEKLAGASVAVTVLWVLSAAVTVACLTNPKACFGSCPTFYVSDGEREIIQAEGFSASIAPALEASDIDALYLAKPASRRLEIRVTNEALETHVIRHAELVAAPRPRGGRVFATPSGELWGAVDIRPPSRCAAAEGSCLDLVREFDRKDRFSESDGRDLATREIIELEFDERDPDTQLGVVIGARQTLLSTFLFYQALAFMGRTATANLARLERGDAGLLEEIGGMHSVLGGIEVQVEDGAGWKSVGEYDETGPIATDVQMIRLPVGSDVRRLRLRLTRGHWRVDFVAVVELEAQVEPVRLQPVEVRSPNGAGGEVRDRLLDPAQTLITLPGDEHTLIYELPADPTSMELFLDSRGYYLEWMREEWAKDENPLAAALMLYAPRQALRFLAPRFKTMEPEMERLFWSSRYARE